MDIIHTNDRRLGKVFIIGTIPYYQFLMAESTKQNVKKMIGDIF